MTHHLYQGIACSNGISIAQAYQLVKPSLDAQSNYLCNKNDAKKILDDAIATSTNQLEKIVQLTQQKLGEEKAAIFEAHIGMVNDPEISKEIEQTIANVKEEQINLVKIVNDIYVKYSHMFEQMDDPYFKERAVDLIDVKDRLIANILHIDLPNILGINQKVIIVCHELTPSDTALLNPEFIMGIVSETGGRTSHAGIMARSLEIPAVFGIADALKNTSKKQVIAIDGEKGLVDFNPDLDKWNDLKNQYIKEQEELKKYINQPTVTVDNHHVHLEANIGNPQDVIQAMNYGCEGVGLYRSEFLYMGNDHWPTEEEQLEGYKSALEKMPNELVIIRTLDIGGDKKLSYYTFPEEMNPFLGFRAIRFCLKHQDIFKTQLRALGRASAYGKLGIMFPMIATIDEFNEAKKIAIDTFDELRKEGHKVADDILIGMMTEIPASAILASEFAKVADFFSIGTNDLIQYTFACDRMNKSIAYLYQPNNPSLLHMVHMAVDGAHSQNKFVAMCGEMAGDINSIPLLLGLGLDRFSMSATSIPKARKLINHLSYKECQDLATQALRMSSIKSVNALVHQFLIERKLINE